MTKIASFEVEDVFEITGRGLVFAGRIVDGVISIGNKVEFNLNNNLLIREILAVEEIRHSQSQSQQINVGLIIKCEIQEEVNKIIESKELLSKINVYNEKLKLSELDNWLSTKHLKHKVLFIELLLSDLTVMNRAIWSDESTTVGSKVESLKWSNELSHRIWNVLFDLRQNEDNDSEILLGEKLEFYAKQSRELAGHLGATINLTINRFYFLTEKNNDTSIE